ncbi:MAG TPA: enolase C-terminal domain-like protein [Candidatus Baltobacteraceae bacterium]|nr:enolase C-terminal domain-like protein [Candidatus Baltobacteraceae bacterium]
MPAAGAVRVAYPIESVKSQAFRIPTEQQPEESDGTLCWNATTLVLVEVHAGSAMGIGYTYADACTAALVNDMLREVLVGHDALQTAACYAAMCAKIRNNGREGITAMAISAVDVALWDLKGKLLQAPVCVLLGAARERIPVYGSGGFTSYSLRRLTEQLSCWARGMEIPRVKMKVGREPDADPQRVAAARKAIGSDAELFVDANGAYSVKQALQMAKCFAEERVTWYEEPVYHNDLAGNAFVREHAPPIMEISNGEYGYAPYNFLQILQNGAADVLQADVTRCGGFSGFQAVDALCEAHDVPLSSHCAPYATIHAAAAAKMVRHIEYFHDHVLIEQRFFDGTPDPKAGCLAPDLDRPGIGLEFKRADAEEFLL